MPHITSSEIAVVSAAFLFFYVVPTVLAWSDHFRERRLRRQAPLELQPESTAGHDTSLPPESVPTSDLTATIPTVPNGDDATTDEGAGAEQTAGGEAAVEAGAQPETAAGASVPAEARTAALVPELQPLVGPARHCFRLRDLHRAQLPDWPPDVIRHDAERSRLWDEAERVAEEQRAAIESVAIHSPYPARTVCLGAADIAGSTVRLRYLLFPSLWPVSQNQAVAQAIFEFDRTCAGIRGWVDALAPSELSEENRHEIRESGGEA